GKNADVARLKTLIPKALHSVPIGELMKSYLPLEEALRLVLDRLFAARPDLKKDDLRERLRTFIREQRAQLEAGAKAVAAELPLTSKDDGERQNLVELKRGIKGSASLQDQQKYEDALEKRLRDLFRVTEPWNT